MTEVADIAQQTTPSPPAPPSSPPLLVRCLRCEYDLRGQPRDARCPECGLPVEPSQQRAELEALKQDPPLRLSSTTWLRNIAIACGLMLIVALLTGVDALRIVRHMDRDDGLQIAQIAIGFGSLALLLIACWLFGTREPLESRGAMAGRYIIRLGGVTVIVLPFALIPLINSYGARPFFFSRVAVLFSVLAALITCLVVRRLAAGARRAGRIGMARFASCFAWLAPPIWVIHAMLSPSMRYEPHAEWLLNARPIIGYIESVVTMPFALSIPEAQWVGGDNKLMLWPWIVEAVISLASLVLLAMMARVFFVASAQSPRPAPDATRPGRPSWRRRC
jgi:hypothetical protein